VMTVHRGHVGNRLVVYRLVLQDAMALLFPRVVVYREVDVNHQDADASHPRQIHDVMEDPWENHDCEDAESIRGTRMRLSELVGRRHDNCQSKVDVVSMMVAEVSESRTPMS